MGTYRYPCHSLASIRLTIHIEAVDKVEDKALVYIEAVEEVYTREINKQDFSKRDTMSIISKATSLLSILLRSERRYTRSSNSILYTH
jgi:hypothetical protein